MLGVPKDYCTELRGQESRQVSDKLEKWGDGRSGLRGKQVENFERIEDGKSNRSQQFLEMLDW